MKKGIMHLVKRITAGIASLALAAATPVVTAASSDAAPSGEISISCYDSMTYKSYLESAAKKFEERYPGTKINVNTFSAMPEVRTVTSENGGMSSMVSLMEDIDDPKAQTDYLTQINTEMISGGGADLFAVDIIPYYKYADNGQLVDMREFMDNDPDFDYESYQKNIFDAAMYKGGQYILPLDYNFDILSYDRELMEQDAQEEIEFGKYTFDRLVELGYDSFINRFDPDSENPIKLFNLYAGEGGMGSSIYGKLLAANYSYFVDIVNKKANFNDGYFADLLNTASEYGEKGYLNVPVTRETMMMGMERGALNMSRMTSSSYLYKLTNQLMLLQGLNDDDTTGSRRSTVMFAGAGGISENDEIIGLLSNENGDCSFTSSMIFAMNENSKNKELAWEFVKFLLSDEMQSSIVMRYTAVNRVAMSQKAKRQITGDLYAPMAVGMSASRPGGERGGEAQAPRSGDQQEERQVREGEEAVMEVGDIKIEDIMLDMLNAEYDDSEVELTEKQQEIFDKYMDYMERFTEMLNTYQVKDIIIQEMVENEAENFFSGSRTAAEIASTLNNKVGMYLQE